MLTEYPAVRNIVIKYVENIDRFLLLHILNLLSNKQ